ncbi:MAG: hypothetical protein LCH52_05615 [Bacteroidetes bacterium]|nr:hypothetical protein [Bacteroidota bacterium]
MNYSEIAAILAFLFTGIFWLGAIFMKYRLKESDPPVIVPKFRTESKAALTIISWVTTFILFNLFFDWIRS